MQEITLISLVEENKNPEAENNGLRMNRICEVR